MSDTKTTVQELKDLVQKIVVERDWLQFHNPKNISMLIATEAAELMEHFRWLECEESKKVIQEQKEEIQQEIADVFFGLLCICFENNIDLSDALRRKIEINIKRYPVEKAKGRREKYTKL